MPNPFEQFEDPFTDLSASSNKTPPKFADPFADLAPSSNPFAQFPATDPWDAAAASAPFVPAGGQPKRDPWDEAAASMPIQAPASNNPFDQFDTPAQRSAWDQAAESMSIQSPGKQGFFESIAAEQGITPAATGKTGFFEGLTGSVSGSGSARGQVAPFAQHYDAAQPLPGEYTDWQFHPSFRIPQGQRLNSFGEFLDRGRANASDMLQGLGVLGNVATSRIMDAVEPQNFTNPGWAANQHKPAVPYIPAPLRNILTMPGSVMALPTQMAETFFTGNEALGTKPLVRVFGNQNEPSDIQTGARIAGDILQGYAQHYADPIRKGDFGAVAGYMLNRPIDAAFDVGAGLGAFKTAAKIGKAAGIAKPLQGAVSMTAQAANTAIPDLVKFAQAAEAGKQFTKTVGKDIIKSAIDKAKASKAGQAVTKAINEGAESIANWNTIRKIIDKADREWQKEFADHLNHAEDAYKQIPKNKWSDKELTDILTMSDMDKYVEATLDPDFPKIQQFMKRANSVNGYLAQQLIDAGVMTEQQVKAATYGDFILGQLRKTDPEVPASVLNTPEGLQMVEQAEQTILATQQHAPIYMGIIPKPVSDAVRGNRGQLFGGVGKSVERAAKADMRSGTVAGDKLSFATPREVGIRDPLKHEMNPMKAFETRLVQELQYLRVKETLKTILDNPNIAGSKEGEKFFLRDFMKDLSTGTGLPQPPWIAHLPEVVRLPKGMAGVVQRALANPSSMNMPLRVWEAPNKVFKTATIGLKPSWAAWQTVQNLGIGVYSKFRGSSPQEMANSIMSHILAFDPEIQRMMPAGITMSMQAEQVAELPTALSKLASPVKAISDKIYGAATLSDNYTRTTHAIYELLNQIDSAQPQNSKALAKAFDIAARYDDIALASQSPVYAERALREVNKWFGDYSSTASQIWRDQRALFPFFLWWTHAASLAKAAIIDTPLKTEVLNKLSNLAPFYWQQDVDEFHKELGMIPKFDPAGNVRIGPNGGMLLQGGGTGMVPLTQSLELLEQGLQWMDQHTSTKTKKGVPVIYPILSWLIATVPKVNPQTLRPWSDPRAIRQGGLQYERGADGQIYQVDPMPNPVQLGARMLVPPVESTYRDMMAGQYMPSDFTGSDFGDAAPKRLGMDQGYEPQLNFPLIQRLFNSVVGRKPTEATMDKDQSEALDAQQQIKLQRSAGRQQARIQPVDTSIGQAAKAASGLVGDILGGRIPGPKKANLK